MRGEPKQAQQTIPPSNAPPQPWWCELISQKIEPPRYPPDKGFVRVLLHL